MTSTLVGTSVSHEAESLYNHVCAPLSDLDLEMVQAVPPGGNWKNIPLSTAKKSARLMQIRASGGRTTYYGRLDWNLPSYTINTYFNRPGNGTFIHPEQDRLISLREAARLQSFRDSYLFLGSRTSKYKQIGNAVPPLLGRAIGTLIKPGRVVDVFSGAGGLSEGLEQAGHRVLLASDFKQHMCSTYEYNHPQTNVVRCDLSKHEDLSLLIDEIERELSGKTLSILAGGPPCQGFSTAGQWDATDSRNLLYRRMLRLVDCLRPDNVVIENVQGIKWMSGGKVLNAIEDVLSGLGYNSSVFILRAEEYLVPQRRRRVFILANRSGEEISRPNPVMNYITRSKKHTEVGYLLPPVSVFEAISDLPVISAGGGEDKTEYSRDWLVSDYQNLMRKLIDIDEFLHKREKGK
jgi:DNA (cytosine-5)-methyltransferase 1